MDPLTQPELMAFLQDAFAALEQATRNHTCLWRISDHCNPCVTRERLRALLAPGTQPTKPERSS